MSFFLIFFNFNLNDVRIKDNEKHVIENLQMFNKL